MSRSLLDTILDAAENEGDLYLVILGPTWEPFDSEAFDEWIIRRRRSALRAVSE